MTKGARLRYVVVAVMILVGILAIGGIASAAGDAQQSGFSTPIMIVNTSFLNVRTGPGVQFSILTTLTGGVELPVLGRFSDNVWYQISSPAGVGWINSEFTILRGDFTNVPRIRLGDIADSPTFPIQTDIGLPPLLALGQGGGQVGVTAGIVAVPEVQPATITTTEIVQIGTGDPNRANIRWFNIVVPGIGTGWVDEGKVRLRLNGRHAQVMLTNRDNLPMGDGPGVGSSTLPILQTGVEGFLRNISTGSTHVQIEIADGRVGWVPFDSVNFRRDTPSDIAGELQGRSEANPRFRASITSTTADLHAQPLPDSDTVGLVFSDPTEDYEILGSMVEGDVIITRTIEVPASPTAGGDLVGPQGTGAFTSPPAPSLGLNSPHVVVNTSFLNVRSGPGAQFSSVTTLRGGIELPVLGLASDGVWFLVNGPFGQGWVNNEFVVFRGNIGSVPIIRNAASGVLQTPVAVITNPVQMFAAPGAGLITTVAPSEAPVVARTADFSFVQINTNVGFGWVSAAAVTIRGDTGLIPIVG